MCRAQLHTIMISPCWAQRVGGEHWQRITTGLIWLLNTQLTDRKRSRTDILTTNLDTVQICSWPRFLLMKGTDNERPLSKLSPFAVNKAIIAVLGSDPFNIKKLRNGEILIEVDKEAQSSKRPLWVRGCRIGPTYPPACRKRRLIGGSLFAVGCNPCQWKRGSWLLSQFFVAALRRQYTALASISLSRKVKMAWLNQSAGSAKP